MERVPSTVLGTLKHCPQNSRRSAYLSVTRHVYSRVVLDPYLQKDIDNLIYWKTYNDGPLDLSHGTISRDEGCVSVMLA